MWYQAKTTTAVTAEPVSLALAKSQCHVETSVDDVLIGLCVVAARDHAEKICGQYFALRTIEAHCDSFADLSRFESVPVVEVVAITYVAADGTNQVLPDTVYELRNDGLDASVVLKYGQVWPQRRAGSRVLVEMKVGADACPPSVLHAMLLMIGAWYENREETVVGTIVQSLPAFVSAEALLVNDRRWL